MGNRHAERVVKSFIDLLKEGRVHWSKENGKYVLKKDNVKIVLSKILKIRIENRDVVVSLFLKIKLWLMLVFLERKSRQRKKLAERKRTNKILAEAEQELRENKNQK